MQMNVGFRNHSVVTVFSLSAVQMVHFQQQVYLSAVQRNLLLKAESSSDH